MKKDSPSPSYDLEKTPSEKDPLPIDPNDVDDKDFEPSYDYWKDFFRMLMILGIIILSLIFSARFFKRLMNSRLKQLNDLNKIKVLEKRTLSQKSVAYLLEVAGKQFVIGESTSSLHFLTEIPLENDDFSNNEKKTFREIMQKKN